ncbi:MAG: CE1 family esterase [Myxococcaceae bacterium]
MSPRLLPVLLLLVAGCSASPPAPDGGEADSGAGADGGIPVDAGANPDAGAADAGPADGGTTIDGGSPGCGKATATGLLSRTITVRGANRNYLLAVPAGYSPATPLSLVFVWHWRGGTAAQARAAFGFEALAAGKAVFVYTDGLPQAIVGGDTGWDLRATGDDVALFDALRAQIAAGWCIDTHRVFSTGFSYGAEFSDSLGCYRASALKGIAPVAGGNLFDGACTGRVSAWMAHGTDDLVLAYNTFGTPSRDHWVAADGCGTTTTAVSPSPCGEYQGCASPYRVVWCAHTGQGGHVIPPWAPSAIWSFFSTLP